MTAMAGAGRIGPNAILQTVQVLDARMGRATRDRVMARAGVEVPPPDAGRWPEAACRAVHLALRVELPDHAAALLAASGAATGDYILAHRIPPLAQRAIRVLPAWAGARVLALAIAKHAWTFAGSGAFRVAGHRPLSFELAGNPLIAGLVTATPACDWHAAVFQRLFAALIWPQVTVEEVSCAAKGGGLCRFVLHPRGKCVSDKSDTCDD